MRAFFTQAVIAVTLFCAGPAIVAAAETPSAAAISSAHPLATEAGFEILEQGGNAFDAAVAVSAVLAVVEPYSSGIGGGGFWLVHRADDGFETMIDGRERAPLAAARDMYLDKSGTVVEGLSINGPLAAGIPGEPAALDHIAAKYGRLPLTKSLAPAIKLAEEGFPVDAIYQRLAGFRLAALQASPEAQRIFLKDSKPPELDSLIRQPELANTLRLLATQGRDGFYRGELAKQLVEGVRKAGGIWQLRDLEEYKVVEREPIRGNYHDIKITSAAPPSSGGAVLVTMLNILQGYDLDNMDDSTRQHVISEAMRRAYRDRAQYLGDPDYIDMPIEMLTNPVYAAGLRASIRTDKATPSASLPGAVEQRSEGNDTTHFSIIDKQGNRVAATLSINYPFGSGFIPPGTGVLLNDEMDDFAAKPGTPNAYGLVGAEANAIAPGKRMLSSMTPTFLDDGERIAIVGTPGGSRIITMVLLATLDFAAGGDADTMVSLPRFHHQYLPDMVFVEPDMLDPEGSAALQSMGHNINQLEDTYGNLHTVVWDKSNNTVSAAADPRGIGSSKVK